jgi:hypothetical protein
VERDVRARDARGGEAPVHLRVHERVGEHEVVVAHVAVVAPHVLAELGPDRREEVGRGVERHQRRVQVVAGPAEHAAALDCPVVHRGAPPAEIVRGGRAQKRRGVARAVLARDGEPVTQRRIVLAVEQRGHRGGPAREARVGGHVADALAADPDVTRVTQSLEVRGSGSCSTRGRRIPSGQRFHR